MFKVNTVSGCCDKCGRHTQVSDIGASGNVVSTHVQVCSDCQKWLLAQVYTQFSYTAEMSQAQA